MTLFDEVSDLEARRRQKLADAEAKRKEIAKLLGGLQDDEKAEREHRRQMREVKKQQEAQQRREESIEQGEAVKAKAEELANFYLQRAVGKPWYSGNDEVPPILDFQWRGALFGAGAGRWILGDGMGLGKTRQSVGWLDLVDAKRVLVVCQADICDQFAGELMTLAPHRDVYNLYKKTPKTRHAQMDKIVGADQAVVIVNYEIWRRDKDLLRKLIAWQIDTVIVDEAHNLKNTATSNFKNVEAIIKADNQCAQCGDFMEGLYDPKYKPRLVPRLCASCGWRKGAGGETYKYLLDEWLSTKSVKHVCFTTGTPLLNSPLDIFSMLNLCDPMLFKRKTEFIRSFCIQNYHSGKVEFRDGQLENLKPLIAGRFIARSRDDAGIVLPVQRKHIVRVDIDPETYSKQYKIIRQLSERASIMLDSGEHMTVMHLIALITRKRQANVWPAGIELTDYDGNVIFSVGSEVQESAKIDALVEQALIMHKQQRRQVVFSQFSTALEALRTRLEAEGLSVALLTGATPKNLRQEIKDNFYLAKGEEPRWDIVLCNYKTGGTGLNLTSATVTHILDEEWNPGKRDQAYARTDRIGQQQENDVYIYRVPASIDTWMSNTIHRKEQMVSAFNDTMTESEGEMTAESLSEAMKSGEVL